MQRRVGLWAAMGLFWALGSGVVRGQEGDEAGTADLDARLASAREALCLRQAPRGSTIEVAVSLSLEVDYLAELALGAARIGAECVVRGVAGGVASPEKARGYWKLSDGQRRTLRASLRAGWQRLSAALTPAAWRIDPAFFEAYGIEAVPVFVLQHEGRALVVRGALTWTAVLDAWEAALGDLARGTLSADEIRAWRQAIAEKREALTGVR